MVILGLDVSTNTIGYAFTENKKILDMGFIDISKQKTIKDKAYQALEMLDDNMHIDKTEKIIVEDSLSGFASGFTSMQTIIKLSKFNAVMCFILEWKYDIEIELINPKNSPSITATKTPVRAALAKTIYVTSKAGNFLGVEHSEHRTPTGVWTIHLGHTKQPHLPHSKLLSVSGCLRHTLI